MDGKPARVQRPREGVVIERDRWGVPHITGKTTADVAFGAGWVTVEDRGLLLELIRGPARAAALDIPGSAPSSSRSAGNNSCRAPRARRSRAASWGSCARRSARCEAADGRAGVRRRSQRIAEEARSPVQPVHDAGRRGGRLAHGTLGAARLRDSPGDVPRRLAEEAGQGGGRAVFDDLRAADDAEAPTIGPGRFEYQPPRRRRRAAL